MLVSIPCVLMRGGTSKGPFFLATDLPPAPPARDRVLLALMGSPDKRQIDGIGGGDSLSSKVAIVNRSTRPGVDVDYLFVQVSVDDASVDTAPNCGNMLAGVAPFAIDHGLVRATDPTTRVRIFNVNTKRIIDAVVQTPGGNITYEGDVRIDGVPGTGAGIALNFIDAAGAKTGKLLPTGNAVDVIDAIEVSCVDFSTPIVFVSAISMGKTGYETKQVLDADSALLGRLESLRRQAAELIGLGDVTGKVLPKIALLAPPRQNGNITSRYFTPWRCHAAHAVTGALGVAAACSIPGTIAANLATGVSEARNTVVIEHPSGTIETRVEVEWHQGSLPPRIVSAGIVRTARPLLSGVVYVPRSCFGQGRADATTRA